MSRFLVVVPPLSGHVNPTVALGGELARRGHAVAWVAYGRVGAALLPPGADVMAIGEDLPDDMVDSVRLHSEGLRGAAALEFLWKDFLLPLATAMVPGVTATVDRFAPDVLVVDQQALAGAVVARRRGLPWATSATTSAELVDPFRGLPKVGQWVRDGLDRLQLEHGVDPSAAGDLRFSEHLVLAYTTEALTGPVTLPPGAGPLSMVGPSIGPPAGPSNDPSTGRARGDDPRHDSGDFPMEWLAEGGPRILVSLGTVSAGVGGRFFGVVVEALEGSDIRAVLVAPPGVVPSEVAGALPERIMARPFVPQLAVLDHVDAVVTHAGHNTVCEALSKGLPMVLAPIRDDQPTVAEQVVRAGAGVRVRFGRSRPPELRAAVDAVLGEPSYREAAGAVQRSFARAGGAAAAVDRLEELVR